MSAAPTGEAFARAREHFETIAGWLDGEAAAGLGTTCGSGATTEGRAADPSKTAHGKRPCSRTDHGILRGQHVPSHQTGLTGPRGKT